MVGCGGFLYLHSFSVLFVLNYLLLLVLVGRAHETVCRAARGLWRLLCLVL